MGEEKIENKTYMIDKETGKKSRTSMSIRSLISRIPNSTGKRGMDFGHSADMSYFYGDKEATKMKQVKSKRLKKKYYKRTFLYQMINGGK